MGALQKNAFGAIADAFARRAAAATALSGQALVEEATRSMGEPKTGIRYPGLPQRSSAPGESPAIQSASLVETLHYEAGHAPDGAVRAGSAAAPYAVELELGSAARHLAPRPYLAPAAHQIARDHFRRLGRALQGKDP